MHNYRFKHCNLTSSRSTGLCYILLVMVMVCSSVFAQDEPASYDKKLEKKAEELFYNEDYKSALPLYRQLYAFNPRDPLYNFCLGVSYLKVAPNKIDNINKLNAIPLLEYAKPNIDIVDVLYYLGSAYHLTYQFEKAIKLYGEYIVSLDRDEPVYLFPLLKKKEKIAIAERNIEMCKNAIVLIMDTVNVEFENMGSGINSPYPDYAPAISADNEVLIFTSRRPLAGSKKMDDDYMYYEDIYIAYNKNDEWTKALPVSENINTGKHDASIGLSADAQTLFIYYDGDIYMAKLEGESWTKPKKLGKEINTPAWETHISITSAQNTVYFVSDRKGGYGGRDIYRARLLPNGEWGNAENLGPVINTPYDEESPFIHPDERHLYFSSTGHNSMGGFDIFYANLDDGVWGAPKNIGHPINTPDDDIYFTISSNGKSGYISAIRDGGIGEKDIYVAKMPDTGSVALTVIRGMIKGLDAKPLKAKFTVTDNETNELVGIYSSNSKTGKYLLVFPPGKDYNIVMSSGGYTPHYEKIDVPEQNRFYDLFQEIQLTPAMTTDSITQKDTMVGQKILIRNAFFDIDSAIAIVDTALAKVEVKELAYSSFLGKIERSEPEYKKTWLAGLDTIEGVRNMIGEYKQIQQVHLVDQSKKENLMMHVMGYDTIYTTSANTEVELTSLNTSEIKLQPTYYVSQTEMDTTKLDSEEYLAVSGLKEGIEEVIKEQIKQKEPTQDDSVTTQESTTNDKPAPESAKDSSDSVNKADLYVTTAVIAISVNNRMPENAGEVFTSDVKKLYCYTNVGLKSGAKSSVHHIWYFNGKKMADVELKVEGHRWRTWSSKIIYHTYKGEWLVDITDSEGIVIKSIAFIIK